MKNPYAILFRWRSGGFPHLIKRAYGRKSSRDSCKPCPPCGTIKVSLPQVAKPTYEKQCHPCAYQRERKFLPPFLPKEAKVVRTKPCPKEERREVEQCPCVQPVPPPCPAGNWNNSVSNDAEKDDCKD